MKAGLNDFSMIVTAYTDDCDDRALGFAGDAAVTIECDTDCDPYGLMDGSETMLSMVSLQIISEQGNISIRVSADDFLEMADVVSEFQEMQKLPPEPNDEVEA